MLAITQKLLPVPSLRRSGEKIAGVRFIVAHDTGNDGSTANGNVSYYIQSAKQMQASAHYFVDDKQIICCIPETEKAWHVRYDVPKDNQIFGKDANDWALSVKLCYSTKGLFDSKVAYKNYVDLMVDLCKRYALNPATDIVAHGTLDPTRRTDPVNALSTIGKTWDQFIADVVAASNPATPPAPVPQPADNLAIIAAIRQKHQEIDDLLGKLK